MKNQGNEILILLAYALAGISGAIGGCGAAGLRLLRGDDKIAVHLAHMAAYAIVGLISGIMFAAYGLVFRPDAHALSQVVPGAIISGLGICLTLAGTNVSARWILRRLGVEVELTVRPVDEGKK